MGSRVRSSGISKTDMEASRLVFVFVRDAKVKRKVAVPVPDGYTWSEFVQQVTTKLKIPGIKDIFLASSGLRVTQLEELQDIDELCVVEGPGPVANGASAHMPSEAAYRTGVTSTSEIRPQGVDETIMTPGRHKVATADGVKVSITGTDDQDKYTKRPRGSSLRRLLQRLFPSVFTPGLPISAKDVSNAEDKGGDARGRRKRRRGLATVGNATLALLVLFSISMMLYVFFRVPKEE